MPSVDPFTLLIGLAVAGYVIGGVTVDAIAVARRMPAPSHEKWKARHEAKQQRGERSDPNPSYLQRVIGNAAEKWAVKSDSKHRADMEFLAERAPQMTAKRLARKRRNAARYETAAQTVADKAGVLWGKTRDAAEQARERRTESRAWRENERRDQQDSDTGLDIVDDDGDLDEPPVQPEARVDPDTPLADVVEFPRPPADQDQPPDPALGEEEPRPYLDFLVTPRDDGQLDIEVTPTDNPTGRARIHGDPADPDSWTGTDRFGRDIQTGKGPAYTDEYGVVHTDDTYLLGDYVSPERRLIRNRHLAPAETNPTSTRPDQEAPSMSTIGNPEITSLSEAQTYTGSMTTSLEQIQVQVDSWSAELTGLADQAEQANVEVEQAIASLRSRDIDGDHLARMEAARDEFSAIAERFRSASEAVGQASGSAESGAAAFRTAHDAFQAQTSLGEEMQAAEASGNRPGDREFYLNG